MIFSARFRFLHPSSPKFLSPTPAQGAAASPGHSRRARGSAVISPEGTGRHRQVNMGEENEDPDWLTAFQVPSRFGVSLLPYEAKSWTGGCSWG